MPYSSFTAVRQLLSDMVGDLVTGTATGGGAASLSDTNLNSESAGQDDLYNGQWLIIATTTDGLAPVGEERRINDFVASSGTCTVYNNFSVPVDASDTYEIHKIWRPSLKRRALNWAIRESYPEIGRNIIDTQLESIANTWAYPLGDYGTGATVTYAATTLTDTGKTWQVNQFAGYLVQTVTGKTATVSSNTATVITVASWTGGDPAAGEAYTIVHPIRDIYAVEYEWSTTYGTYTYQKIPYEVREHEGSRILQFYPSWVPPDGRTIRIRGRGYLSDFTNTETSTIQVEEEELDGILFLAAHFLFRQTPALAASQDRDFYREEAGRYLAMWEARKKSIAVRRFPVKVWSPGMAGPDGASQLSEVAMFDLP